MFGPVSIPIESSGPGDDANEFWGTASWVEEYKSEPVDELEKFKKFEPESD